MAERKFASVEHLNPEAVAAFVDEELTPGAMHRAKIHLVHCPECRREVATQRKASERLRAQDFISAPDDLLQRLTKLSTSCPDGPGVDGSLCSEPATLIDKVETLYRAVRRRGKA